MDNTHTVSEENEVKQNEPAESLEPRFIAGYAVPPIAFPQDQITARVNPPLRL